MGCKQLWYQHAFHVKQGQEDMWSVCVCVLCMCLHYALFGTFSLRGVCYPHLLESDPRLCLIGVFTLSGLTHTDTLDLGFPPFAMKRENSDRNIAWFFAERNFNAANFCFPPLFFLFFAPVYFRATSWSFLHLMRWTFQLWRQHLRDVQWSQDFLSAISLCST